MNAYIQPLADIGIGEVPMSFSVSSRVRGAMFVGTRRMLPCFVFAPNQFTDGLC